MSGCGLTIGEIATVLELSEPTVTKYFKYEIATAALVKNSAVAAALYKQATRFGNVSAMTFWLKCRARWKPESSEFEESQTAAQQARSIREALLSLDELENAEV